MKKLNKNLALISTIILTQFNLSNTNAQEVGLQLYSLRNEFKTDVISTLDSIQSWGITKLEGGDTYGLPLEEFKKAISDRGMQVVSVGASYNDLQNNVYKVIKSAKDFGATYVMCPWIPHNENIFTIKETQRAVEVFNKAGKVLKAEGKKNPHGYEFRPYKEGTLFDYMAQNSKHFNFEMDVFWVKQGGVHPLSLLKKYPTKFLLMHLKDRAIGTVGNQNGRADVEANVILGTGDVGIADLVTEAKKLKIAYLFIEDESSSVVQQIPKSLLYLNGLDN